MISYKAFRTALAFVGVTTAGGFAGGSAMAQGTAVDPASLAARFGALESVRQLSLSPSGDKIAYIAPRPQGGAVIMVVDLAGDGQPKAILAQRAGTQNLRWCAWPTETRLICSNYTVVGTGSDNVAMSRLIVLNADGSNPRQLTADGGSNTIGAVLGGGGDIVDWNVPGKPDSILLSRYYLPEVTIGSNAKREVNGFGVEEVDTRTLLRHNVERPAFEAVQYLSDGSGNVRVMGVQPRDPDGEQRGHLNYSYRAPGSREWHSLSRVRLDDTGMGEGFEPLAVDATKNVVYGVDSLNGFKALYSISLDGEGTRTLVLAKDGVDVDDVVQIGRDRRVVGATYAGERREYAFFDPELKSLGAGLSRALPGQPLVGFIGASADANKLLLLASSDVDPGTFYRFDKTTKALAPLLPVRNELSGIAMGQMRAITFPAADGTMIPGYLTLPPGSEGRNLPAIVMPHGGPASRDEWGFDWLVQYFAVRGYAVLQPNYRGSAGLGSEWYRQNGFQSWRTAIGDVDDAGRWLLKQGIAAPGKLAIVGWSYGGYAALQGAALDPDLYKAAVAVAPVTDLARLKNDVGQLGRDFIGSGPHISEGSPAQNAERIKIPVLLFHGDHDANVDIAQSRVMRDKLKAAGKDVTLVEFPGLDHQLFDASARTRVLADSDAFIRKALGL